MRQQTIIDEICGDIANQHYQGNIAGIGGVVLLKSGEVVLNLACSDGSRMVMMGAMYQILNDLAHEEGA